MNGKIYCLTKKKDIGFKNLKKKRKRNRPKDRTSHVEIESSGPKIASLVFYFFCYGPPAQHNFTWTDQIDYLYSLL